MRSTINLPMTSPVEWWVYTEECIGEEKYQRLKQ